MDGLTVVWCRSDMNAASEESVDVTSHTLVKVKLNAQYMQVLGKILSQLGPITQRLVPQHFLTTKCNEPPGHRGPLSL